MEYTKDNPGDYKSAVEYASKQTGISTHKEIVVPHMKDLYRYRRANKNGMYGKLKYNADNIRVKAYNETIHPFMLNGERFDERSPLVPKEFIVTVMRQIEEFGLEVKHEGFLFSINEKYFTNGLHSKV